MSKFNPIDRYLRKPSSRTLAVHAMCASCVGCTEGHLEKGFKETISACSSYSCPLRPFRPYQAKKSLEGEKMTIQNP